MRGFLFSKNNLEQLPHGRNDLRGGLLRLYPEEPVPSLGRSEHVPEGAPVRAVLGDEADLVHGVVVHAVLKF